MVDVASSFPKALSYSIKSMVGNMSRIGVKMTPDRTSGIVPNDVVTIKLPNSSLVDLRTFNFFYQFSTSATTGVAIHPRYASSLLERVSIIINGQTISITPAYNLLYNTLMDMEGSSIDQFSKRGVCEFFDPSLNYTLADVTSAADENIAANNATRAAQTAPSKWDGAITHWLGFLGSCVPQVIDTSDLGDVFIQLQFASPYVLPATIATTNITPAGFSFTLDTLYATCDVISFASDEYYNLKAAKLASSGLNIGFYEYLNARFANVAKNSGVSVNWNVSANSLDQLIATFQKSDAQSSWKRIIAYGANGDGSVVYNMLQLASNPIANTANTGAIQTEKTGDCFMNSNYFMRNGAYLKEARWSINNRPINYGYLTPKEVFIQSLTALGYNHIDLGSNGLNVGIWSLQHFLKYYFCHVIDLTIQDTQNFWISGLNSLGSTLTITYDANFSGTSNSQSITPVLFARLSKILAVKPGRNLSVI